MLRRNLKPEEKRDWLRLSRTENVGPITFRQLLRKFDTADKALRALPELAQRGGSKRSLNPPSVAQIEDECARLHKRGGQFIASCEPAYPEALAALDEAPPLLATLGAVSLFQKRAIALVGARNASLNGRKMAETLARDLGQQDIAIVSGLARGIDTSAHKASLPTGTIAVLAGGVDRVYPEENQALYDEICAHGLVVSDQPMGSEPRAQLFPKRNRIVSGLSLGVVVVEAALKSGSLITARYALDQGREVFAVPGSPLDPRANGTNDLLRQGAVLVERAADVLNHIHTLPQRLCEPGFQAPLAPLPPADERECDLARAKIVENLGFSPVAVDELIRQCQFSPSVVLTILLELELAGRLERQPGHKVTLVAST